MYVIFLQGCPPFSHLTLTGGAIGSGPPLAVGAAIACPDRCVINIQVNPRCCRSVINNDFWHVGSHPREHQPHQCSCTTVLQFEFITSMRCVTRLADICGAS